MLFDITLTTILFLVFASFFAGFVDSIAGGGGLIQLPALLIGLPKSETVTVLGTNKFASVFGTTAAAALYRRQIRPNPKISGINKITPAAATAPHHRRDR